jgi:hypothetical protein
LKQILGSVSSGAPASQASGALDVYCHFGRGIGVEFFFLLCISCAANMQEVAMINSSKIEADVLSFSVVSVQHKNKRCKALKWATSHDYFRLFHGMSTKKSI